MAEYPYDEGDFTVIGPECFTAVGVISYKGENFYGDERITMALGWISADLAGRADAWNGNAPEWFPEPPEWPELWSKALEATVPNPGADYRSGD